ncbi:SCO-spondin [Acipenser ruthenus]|uniref:SCO-spondin n=1 Tax=Acipenser ruthenus TaxID=7906 RepID=UPI002740AF8C|nr:SCO-spondin [Acipenser ruthenus]
MQRWCERTVQVLEEEVLSPRLEQQVPCAQLYQFNLEGWRIDVERMRHVHGGDDGIAQYYLHNVPNAMCYIHKPPEMQSTVHNRTVRECCEGWSGPRCTEGAGVRGHCYSTWNCQDFLGVHNTSLMPMEECCSSGWGHSWRNGSDQSCFSCSYTFITEPLSSSSFLLKPHLSAGLIGAVRDSRVFSTCLTWSGTRFRTFDGRHFPFEGSCTYNLASSLDGTWAIYISSPACGAARVCSKALKMMFGLELVTVQGRNVSINGVLITEGQPLFKNGISIRWLGDFIFIESGLGVRVKYNRDNIIYVTVTAELKGTTRGLCGVYNDNPNDDFTTMGGAVSQFAASFGNSWRVPDVQTESCNDAAELGHSCDITNDPALRVRAESVCKRLLASPFSQCHSKVDPAGYLDTCQYLYCSQGGGDRESATCDTFASYARECIQQHVIVDWRRNGFCERRCGQGQVYSDCVSACPPSCTGVRTPEAGHCRDECVSGCECPPGSYLEEGACVSEEDCPCYHRRSKYNPGDTIRQKCNLCVCQGGRWLCSQEKCSAQCSVIGDAHYITFDRKRYSFHGTCDYTLVEDFVDNKLLITVENAECGSRGAGSCLKGISITVYKTTVRLRTTGDVTVNGQEVDLPFVSVDLAVRRASSSFLLVQLFGAHVLWGLEFPAAYITLQPGYANKVRGLCGTYNWNQHDDFTTPEGDVEPSTAAFANKFRTSLDCPPISGLTFDPCGTYAQRRQFAEDMCAVIHSSVFEPCHDLVEREPYYRLCLYDVCGCAPSKQCLCSAVAAYARQCAQEGAAVSWRNRTFCSVQCSGGQAFSECSRPCESSCADVRQLSGCEAVEGCVSGCNCPEGLAQDSSGQCVPVSMCPCIQGGTIYQPGSTIQNNCNTCVCVNGLWNCSEDSCPDVAQCPGNLVYSFRSCLQTCDSLESQNNCSEAFDGCVCPEGTVLLGDMCVPPSECPCHHNGKLYYENDTIIKDCNTCVCRDRHWKCGKSHCSGSCMATGDPHYITFDGRAFTFLGDCEYVLAQESAGLFTVTAENVPCGTSGVTCTKSVVVTLGNTIIHMLRGKAVTVNGVAVRLPKTYSGSGLTLDRAGLFLTLTAKLGLTLLWDGGTRLYMKLDPSFQGRVGGLCGNFDGDTENDFTTRQGIVESTSDLFGNSWRVSQSCPEVLNADLQHPCTEHPHRATWARKRCSIITQDLFSPCHQEVPCQQFYDWCVFDACGCDSGGDCECLCTAIAAYAEECNKRGVYTRWRSQELCPMQCDNGLVYEACGPACTQTCESLRGQPDPLCSALSCVEGCFCSEGTVLHDGSCIDPSQCPCEWEDTMFPPGAMVTQDCQNCSCSAGAWLCSGQPCVPRSPCLQSEFQCVSGRCVPSLWVCDNEDDCGDGSDEVCTASCGPQQFSCDSGQCVPLGFRCDGQPDCADHSDEAHCPPTPLCPHGEFRCANGRCVSQTRVCDGELDCGFADDSDEADCVSLCGSAEFRCSVGRCVLYLHRCDGHDDCGDLSDERGCVCAPGEFQCPDRRCLSPERVCDGQRDCSSGIDEAVCQTGVIVTCAPGQLVCGDGSCLGREKVCDGVPDCQDGADESEAHCHGVTTEPVATTTPGSPGSTPRTGPSTGPCSEREFQCVSGECKPRAWLCDGEADCADGSDEQSCNWTCRADEYLCQGSGECIRYEQLCDGTPHCRDHSDESLDNCGSTQIPPCPGSFTCNNRVCVNTSRVCNGVPDCPQGEDELACDAGTVTTVPPGAKNTSASLCPEYTCADGSCITFKQVCNGVAECAGEPMDEQGCGVWEPWGPWGSCSETCGTGSQSRQRRCSQETLLKHCWGEEAQRQQCFSMACAVDGAWSPWTTWSNCTRDCSGVVIRRRECIPPQNGGRPCSALPGSSPSTMEIKPCHLEGCPNVTSCPGDLEVRSCAPCPLTCADLAMAVSCEKERSCFSGCWCPDGLVMDSQQRCVQTEDCPCEVDGVRYWPGQLVKVNCQICTCRRGRVEQCRHNPECSVNCGWSSWSSWGECLGPCGVQSVQWSFRSPNNPSKHGSGKQCRGIYRKARRCQTEPCDECEFHGEAHTIGDRWKLGQCQVCQCLPNLTVHCSHYCPYTALGCPEGRILVPGNGDSCCYCAEKGGNVTGSPTATPGALPIGSITTRPPDSTGPPGSTGPPVTTYPINPGDECYRPLGLQQTLPDSSFTASSQQPDNPASAGRLNHVNPHGDLQGWGPDPEEYRELLSEPPFLQIDLLYPRNITGVVVQGGGAFDTFVSSFYLQLSADGRRWYTYQELPTDARPRAKMFQGNSDDSTAVENRLQRMVSAHYVRILPHDFQNGIYLRAELLGCGEGTDAWFSTPSPSTAGAVWPPLTPRTSGGPCQSGEFHCHNDHCVSAGPGGVVCNGVNDCGDSSDELYCGTSPSPVSRDRWGCLSSQFHCSNPGLCIDSMRRCDGREDCADGADELSCVSSHLSTPSTKSTDSPGAGGRTPQTLGVPSVAPVTLSAQPGGAPKTSTVTASSGTGVIPEPKGPCNFPLGLEDGRIRYQQLSSSTHTHNNSPDAGRLNIVPNILNMEPGWSPLPDDPRPYFQVDFLQPTFVSGIISQGTVRASGYITKYRLEYSLEGRVFHNYTESRERPEEAKVFVVNVDSNIPVKRTLKWIILARFLRIFPVEYRNNFFLRVEILGCPWDVSTSASGTATTPVGGHVTPGGGSGSQSEVTSQRVIVTGSGTTRPTRCMLGEFECGSGECVNASTALCDGQTDCRDHSDEMRCGTVAPLTPAGRREHYSGATRARQHIQSTTAIESNEAKSVDGTVTLMQPPVTPASRGESGRTSPGAVSVSGQTPAEGGNEGTSLGTGMPGGSLVTAGLPWVPGGEGITGQPGVRQNTGPTSSPGPVSAGVGVNTPTGNPGLITGSPGIHTTDPQYGRPGLATTASGVGPGGAVVTGEPGVHRLTTSTRSPHERVTGDTGLIKGRTTTLGLLSAFPPPASGVTVTQEMYNELGTRVTGNPGVRPLTPDANKPGLRTVSPLPTSGATRGHVDVWKEQSAATAGSTLSMPTTWQSVPLLPRRLCMQGQFTCRLFGCVEAMFVCDGQRDCLDGSDEEHCGGLSSSPVPTATIPPGIVPTRESSLCSAKQFRCLSGECIHLDRKCDLQSDCQDGSDEQGCVDCIVSPWGQWSECSQSCGLGSLFRQREVLREAQPGGVCNTVLFDIRACFSQACPASGQWTEWSEWSACDAECSGGVRLRDRSCSNPPPKNRGLACEGEAVQTEFCNLQPCNHTTATVQGCAPDMVYMTEEDCEAGSLDPCPLSCRDLSAEANCSMQCVEGCRCPPGLYLQWGRCVNASQCLCHWNNEIRQPGETFNRSNCSQCMCLEGRVSCDDSQCPVNCDWSAWSPWTPCDSRCGVGIQERYRSPSNPPALNGGSPCPGDSVEARKCHSDCPTGLELQGQQWSEWTPWSQCSKSCFLHVDNVGVRRRFRSCNDTAGDACSGAAEEQELCATLPCPVPGGWSSWSPWSSCTSDCDSGVQTRNRRCTAPLPKHGGEDCPGPHIQTRDCNTQPCQDACPDNMVYQSAEECQRSGGGCPRMCLDLTASVECATACYEGCYCTEGLYLQNDSCVPPNQCWCYHLGQLHPPGTTLLWDSCNNCTCSQGEMVCGTTPCPMDCGWSAWTQWSSCSKTCDVGTRRRYRSGTNPPAAFGGRECPGSSVDMDFCSLQSCKGVWSEWASWSECTVPCGGGYRNRTRIGTGSRSSEYASCNVLPCGNVSSCPSDRQWKACADDHVTCADLSLDSVNKTCEPGCYCPEGTLLQNLECVPVSKCQCVENGEQFSPGDIVRRDCNNCSCVDGRITNCTQLSCDVNGQWSEWTPWSECSVTCGTGLQNHYRFCASPARSGSGLPCIGPDRQDQICNTAPCALSGGWSGWSNWTECTKSCGGGVWSRSRECDSPTPGGDGDYCEGPSSEVSSCHSHDCPAVDCSSIEGSVFSSCGPSCPRSCDDISHCVWSCEPGCYCSSGKVLNKNGTACVERQDCTCLDLRTGERFLPGETVLRADSCNNCTCVKGKLICTNVPCAVSGGWCEWSGWTPCSRTCGMEMVTRYRSCSCPAPQNRGAECEGVHEHHADLGVQIERKQCPSVSFCPVHGSWSLWGPWSPCDGCEGVSVRTRECNSPPARFGGLPCHGEVRQSRGCHDNETVCSECGGGLEEFPCGKPCPRSCSDFHSDTVCEDSGECQPSCGCPGQQVLQDGECVSPSQCRCKYQNNTTGMPETGNGTWVWPGSTLWEYSEPGETIHTACQNCTCDSGHLHCKADPACRLDGSWSPWGAWSPCSESCGDGTQYRFRECSNPAPQNGGRGCPGEAEQQRDCNSLPCGDASPWWEWSPWMECTVTCGGGEQIRTRSCRFPDCPGLSQQSKTCNTQVCLEVGCPPDRLYRECLLGEGCPYSCAHVSGLMECFSESCEEGCHCPVNTFFHNGSCITECPCVLDQETLQQMQNHSVNGSTTPTLTAQGATLTLGDELPPGEALHHGCSSCVCQHSRWNCSLSSCPLDGGLSPWGTWGSCSLTCGGLGHRTRTRDCTDPAPAHGGKDCAGAREEVMYCQTPDCPAVTHPTEEPTGPEPSDGFGPWTSWSPCSQSCSDTRNPALKTRTRVCERRDPCTGEGFQERACNLPQCATTGVEDCQGEDCASRNCSWNPWADWGECSRSCGVGQQQRIRTFLSPGANGSWCDDILGGNIETRFCNIRACRVNGSWSRWSPWSWCDRKCGGGKSIRTRSCSSPPPKNGGNSCEGEKNQVKICNSKPCDGEGCPSGLEFVDCANRCPRHCSDLQQGITCQDSTECQPGCRCPAGYLEQDGACVQPWQCECADALGHSWAPGSSLGQDCNNCTCAEGRISCTNLTCPAPDCGWSSWSTWSSCSVSCGAGRRTRFRSSTSGSKDRECQREQAQTRPCDPGTCPPLCLHDNQELSLGATWLVGECQQCICTPEGVYCQDIECKVDGGWTPWSLWSDCPVTCGGGTQIRTRACINPPPRNHGSACEGPEREAQECGTQPCQEDACPWSPWSPCSQSCGTGLISRERSCSCEEGESEENTCPPESQREETQLCYNQPCPDCPLSAWSEWTACSCTSQLQHRYRTPLPPTYRGQHCEGLETQSRACPSGDCGDCVTPFQFMECGSPCEKLCSTVGERGHCASQQDCVPGCYCPEGLLAQNETCVPAAQCGCLHLLHPENGGTPIAVSVQQGEIVVSGCRICVCQDGEMQCDFDSCEVTLSEWSEWTPCSPCLSSDALGRGMVALLLSRTEFTDKGTDTPLVSVQRRYRACLDLDTGLPVSEEFARCTGELEQERLCLDTTLCEDLCQWSPWSVCREPCSGGFQQRQRHPQNTKAGHTCQGPRFQSQSCNTALCPGEHCEDRGKAFLVSCANQCPRTCADLWDHVQCLHGACRPGCRCPEGWLLQDASCVSVSECRCGLPSINGTLEFQPGEDVQIDCKNCTCVNGSFSCTEEECPSYSPWSTWSECSVNCGAGERTRNRTCEETPSSQPCTAETVQREECQLAACPVSCVVSEWSAWSECSATCGGGVSLRNKTVVQPAEHGGQDCPTPLIMQRVCNSHNCTPECPGALVFSSCSNACPRSCADLLQGTECLQEACEEGCACPTGQVLLEEECVPPEECPCAVLALSLPWTLNMTLEERSRVFPPGTTIYHQCNNCTCQSGSFTCSEDLCDVDCQWSDWSEWTPCSVSCGTGVLLSSRIETLQRQYNGKDCEGSSQRRQLCVLPDCECPLGQRWRRATEGTPMCERTCQEMYDDAPQNCSAPRGREGCVCEAGWYRNSSGDCVTAAHCECVDGGHIYQAGQEWTEGCGRCRCENGRKVCEVGCPPLVCVEGQVKVEEPGSCCPVCRKEFPGQPSPACQRYTETRNITKGDCRLDNVEVSYCSGQCLSRTIVILEEPYLQSLCDCCSYRLDPESPVRLLSLQCESGGTESIVLPVIHSCECSRCQGGDSSMR